MIIMPLLNYEHLSLCQILLDHGADVNLTDSHGQTAATLATNNDSPSCLSILLERGSKVSHQDQYGISLLTEVISKEKLVHAEVIIQHNANLNMQDFIGMSALHWAASLGKDISIKLLHDKGADINLRSNDGKTPLVEAIGEDRYICIKTLLKLGCDTNIATYNGWAPIIHLARGYPRCLNLLLRFHKDNVQFEVNGESALAHAIRASNSKNVRLLIKKGAPVQSINVAGLGTQPWGSHERQGYVYLSVAAGVQHTLYENHVGYSAEILPHYSDQPNPKVPCASDKLCRQALSKCLLVKNVSPETNLFCLVKYLLLPDPVREFLMFGVGTDDYCHELVDCKDSSHVLCSAESNELNDFSDSDIVG